MPIQAGSDPLRSEALKIISLFEEGGTARVVEGIYDYICL
jgi:hypothetical protein